MKLDPQDLIVTSFDTGDQDGLRAAYDGVAAMVRVLGLGEVGAAPESGTATETALSALIEELITQRAEARASKDWATADRIRDLFATAGVALEDNADGTVWSING